MQEEEEDWPPLDPAQLRRASQRNRDEREKRLLMARIQFAVNEGQTSAIVPALSYELRAELKAQGFSVKSYNDGFKVSWK